MFLLAAVHTDRWRRFSLQPNSTSTDDTPARSRFLPTADDDPAWPLKSLLPTQLSANHGIQTVLIRANIIESLIFTTPNHRSSPETFLPALHDNLVPDLENDQTTGERQRSSPTRMLCTITPVHKRRLCSDYHQHSKATSTYPRLTKNWINRDIDQSRFCDVWVHIFDRLRLYLQPTLRFLWSSRLAVAKTL